MDLNLVLHPAPPSAWPSVKMVFQVLIVAFAMFAYSALASVLGYEHLAIFGDRKGLVVLVIVGFALVPIPYAMEFVRNRSWSRTFRSTAGKVQVQQGTLALELELISRGDSIDEGSAAVEVLLRWRKGVLRWTVLSVTLEDVLAVPQRTEADATTWKLEGSASWTEPTPEGLRSDLAECEVGVSLKAAGRTRTRVLEGRCVSESPGVRRP